MRRLDELGIGQTCAQIHGIAIVPCLVCVFGVEHLDDSLCISGHQMPPRSSSQ